MPAAMAVRMTATIGTNHRGTGSWALGLLSGELMGLLPGLGVVVGSGRLRIARSGSVGVRVAPGGIGPVGRAVVGLVGWNGSLGRGIRDCRRGGVGRGRIGSVRRSRVSRRD